MKDKKIRILCIVASVLSVIAIVPVMFEFFVYYTTDIYGYQFSYAVYGFELYSDTQYWWYLLIGILGIISLLWNLIYGAYAIIDGRYRNLTWRIARYGYFYGIVVGVINFAVIMSTVCGSRPAAWSFLIIVAATVAVEIVLILLKDEDSKTKLSSN
ncbi:MAG: hypothetical protein K2N30_00420 [Clostridia bacterium]|nr:hypothetical protein [Clostridia bacterium]